jgi:acyl carrier protein
MSNDRYYETGDLARWQPDGNIEFLGRIDLQVKVRGFRIELEEIESHLLTHKDVKEAVVAIAGNMNTGQGYSIAAYIVPNWKKIFSASGLRRYLSKKVPGYMIPSHFVEINTVPLTAAGKVDRKKLLSMGTILGTGLEYKAPESRMEKLVASAWQEVLQRDKIGINDNFFDLGGNSMSILLVNAKLSEELNVSLPIATLFQYPSIGSLAGYLSKDENRYSAADVRWKELESLEKIKDSLEETTRIFG